MAIYHNTVKVIGNTSGRSPVALSAYINGEKMVNDHDGRIHDYSRKRGVVHSEVMLCENAPAEYANREALWNAVTKNEGSVGQRTRTFEFALPRELNRPDQIKLVQCYVRDNFVNEGMCADFAIHDKRDGNPHAHVMLTMRPLDENGNWETKTSTYYYCKNRQGEEKTLTAEEWKNSKDEWLKKFPYYKDGIKNSKNLLYITKHEAQSDPQYNAYKRVPGAVKVEQYSEYTNPAIIAWSERTNMEKWRKDLAARINLEFEKKNLPDRVDHRSYERQGVEQIPTKHMGAEATALERKGKHSVSGNINREIAKSNLEIKKANSEIKTLEAERDHIVNRIRQDNSWTQLHEANAKFYKNVADNSDNGKYQRDALAQILPVFEKLLSNIAQSRDYHSDDSYYNAKDRTSKSYQEYHYEKARSDINAVRSIIEKNIVVIERRTHEHNILSQTGEKGQASQIDNQMGDRGIRDRGGDSIKLSVPTTTNDTTPVTTYDISTIAKQLEHYRSEFIAATALAAERTDYKIYPIYRQQAAQIQSCVNAIREQTDSIHTLHAQKDALRLFQGKQKKVIDKKIASFKRHKSIKQAELKTLGVSDLSQADNAMKKLESLAKQEKEKVQLAQESQAASNRVAAAKKAFIALAQSVPSVKRQALLNEMDNMRSNDADKEISTRHQYKAEIIAKEHLDVFLKPRMALEQSNTQERIR